MALLPEPLFLGADGRDYLEGRYDYAAVVQRQFNEALSVAMEKCNGTSTVIFAAERLTMFASSSTPEAAELLLQPLAALALRSRAYALGGVDIVPPRPVRIPRQLRSRRKLQAKLSAEQRAVPKSFQEELQGLLATAGALGLSVEQPS